MDDFEPDDFVPDAIPTRSDFLSRHQAASQATEGKIQGRHSSIGFLRAAQQNPKLMQEHPFITGLSTIGAIPEAAESVPANIGLGIQQRKPMGEIGKNIVAGLSGNRPAQLGDIARASAIPVLSSEPVAAATGLFASTGAGLATKASRGFLRGASQEVEGHLSGAASLATHKGRVGLANRVNSIGDNAREALSKQFGEAIDQASAQQVADPSKLMDLEDVGRALQPVSNQLSTGAKHAASDLVKMIADEPSLAKNLSLDDARAIKAGIQRTPEINRPTEAGRILRMARDLIRAKEVDTFPQLAETFKTFKRGMDAYRTVQPRLEKVGTSAPVTSGLKNLTEAELARESVQHLASFSGSRKPFAEVLGAARTAGFQRGASNVGRALLFPLLGAAGAYAATRKLFGRSGGGSHSSQ